MQWYLNRKKKFDFSFFLRSQSSLPKYHINQIRGLVSREAKEFIKHIYQCMQNLFINATLMSLLFLSLGQNQCGRVTDSDSEERRDHDGGAGLRSRHAMGSNISQHSSKGLKGRRARSSGDLCNGDTKSQTESSVCGSVVGDVMGWNRSLPNHLDGNRHLADYSRVNNNYGELGTYNRCQKGGRGLRYRVSKSGKCLI